MNTEQQGQPLAAIRFLKGTLTGITFHISEPITTIGRDKSNDITILDQKASGFHARLSESSPTYASPIAKAELFYQMIRTHEDKFG